jgi:hypothetical protein
MMAGCRRKCAAQPTRPASSRAAAQPAAVTAASPGPLARNAAANNAACCKGDSAEAAAGHTCRGSRQTAVMPLSALRMHPTIYTCDTLLPSKCVAAM